MLKSLARAARNLAPGARKASASGRAVAALYDVGQPAWTPRDYEHLAREGFMSAVWAFACVREIVTALKVVPVYARRVASENPERVPDTHPLARLIRRPNPLQAWPSYAERLAAHLLLSGNAYAEGVPNAVGRPVELYALRPDRVRVVPGRDGHPVRYVYAAGGTEVTYRPELIRHLRTFHPTDDLYGFAPLEAAARAVDFHAAGMAHNTALLQNGARPSGALSTDRTLTDAEHTRLRREIDRLLDPLDRKGRPLLLEAGLQWVEMGLSPKDIDFHKGSEDAARQIHAAFGVHPVLTGLQAGTYENQAEALRSLYTRVVLPLLAHILTELGAWLAPQFGDEALELYADADAVDALSEDREAVWRRASRAYVAGLVTLNEARREMGYEARPDGEELRPQPTASPEGPVGGSEGDGEGESTGEATEARSEPLSARERAVRELKAAKAASMDDLRDKWTEHMAARMRRHFRREREAVMAALAHADEVTLPILASEALLREELQAEAEEELLAVLGAAGRAEHELLTRHSTTPPESKADRLPSLFGLLFPDVVEWARRRAAELV
ncbi:MAG TPA: phage portal protein, partial [Longimicrobiales bacterium]